MTTIALAIFFVLFALVNLGASIPGWTLGVAAILVVVALALGGGWRNNKATVIALLLLPALLLSGCMTAGGFAKIVKEGGTANKDIDMKFSGWNAHVEYKSTVFRNSVPTSVASEALTIVPVTRLETFRSGQTKKKQ